MTCRNGYEHLLFFKSLSLIRKISTHAKISSIYIKNLSHSRSITLKYLLFCLTFKTFFEPIEIDLQFCLKFTWNVLGPLLPFLEGIPRTVSWGLKRSSTWHPGLVDYKGWCQGYESDPEPWILCCCLHNKEVTWEPVSWLYKAAVKVIGMYTDWRKKMFGCFLNSILSWDWTDINVE